MAGQYGSRSLPLFLRDMNFVISQVKHEYLMEEDPEYAKIYDEYALAQSQADIKKLQKRLMSRVKVLGLDKRENIAKLQFKKNAGNRDKMIYACMPLVLSVAKKILWKSKSNVMIDDLIQAGCLGAVLAADYYLNTPFPANAKPAKFSSYAYYWIFKYVLEESVRSGTILSGTKRDVYDANKYTKIVVDANDDNDDSTNPNSYADRQAYKSHDFSELKIVEDEAARFKHESMKLFKCLTKEEKRKIFMLYGIDTPNGEIYSQRDICKVFGKSPSQI